MATTLVAPPRLKPRDRGSLGSRAGIGQSKCRPAPAGPLAVTSPACAPVIVQPSGKPMLPDPSGNGVWCSAAAGVAAPPAAPPGGELTAAEGPAKDGALAGAVASVDPGGDAGVYAAAPAALLPVPDRPAPPCNLF